MARRTKRILLGLLLLLVLLAISMFMRSDRQRAPQSRLVAQAAAPAAEGFQRAIEPIELEFPRDHGPHPEYQTEWWYYTGNLNDEDGRHYGFQLTFFRRSLAPPEITQDRPSTWANGQVYMAHFAISDTSAEQHQEFERLSRGSAGLAGAQADPFRVWLEDWSVEETAPAEYRLRASQDGYQIDLTLTDLKGPVLHGVQGLSRKGQETGQASYYISQPRLKAEGKISTPGQTSQVVGEAWMDHEFSTSALAPDQIGWDWFSIQLDDGRELMVFQIRKADGTIDPVSSGTLIAADGTTTSLGYDDFSIEVTRTWKSPDSAAIYPAGWVVRLPSQGLTLEITPYFDNQEMNVSYDYWEGAVRFNGTQGSQPVTGRGYVELTGYAGSMGGEF
jgi:predicted secreted hydrolase